MTVIYFVLVIFSFCVLHGSYAGAGDPVVYFPPFELRAVSGDSTPFMVPVNEFQPMATAQSGRQQRVLHTNQNLPLTPNREENVPNDLSPSMPTTTVKPDIDNRNISLHDVLSALGVDESGHMTKDNLRAAARDYDSPPSSGYPGYSPYPPSSSYGAYGYPARPSYPPSYGSYSPPSPPQYHEQPYAYMPPVVAHHSPAKVKTVVEKFPDLLKPVATKVASKFSGLIGLVLTLLTGSSAGDSDLLGFKDLIVNGIVKPLLIAKGGIKSLISKLTIPIISLLLINLEVLITVWWLWEDCPAPQPVHVQPPYSYPKPSYNYNSYR